MQKGHLKVEWEGDEAAMSPILSVYDRTNGSRKELVLEKTEVDAVLTHLVQSRGLIPSPCPGTIQKVPVNMETGYYPGEKTEAGNMPKGSGSVISDEITHQNRVLNLITEQLYRLEDALGRVVGEKSPEALGLFEIHKDNRLQSLRNNSDFMEQLHRRLIAAVEVAEKVL